MCGYIFLNQKYGFSIPCLFRKITGYYCPGCGITRLLFSLIKLEIYQAFRFNPLVFLFIILFLVCKIIKLKINDKATFVLIIITIIFGILRNIDYFDFLRPTLI